jgi:hypothetical protein
VDTAVGAVRDGDIFECWCAPSKVGAGWPEATLKVLAASAGAVTEPVTGVLSCDEALLLMCVPGVGAGLPGVGDCGCKGLNPRSTELGLEGLELLLSSSWLL